MPAYYTLSKNFALAEASTSFRLHSMFSLLLAQQTGTSAYPDVYTRLPVASPITHDL